MGFDPTRRPYFPVSRDGGAIDAVLRSDKKFCPRFCFALTNRIHPDITSFLKFYEIKMTSIETVQATVGADPNIALPIFQECIDVVALQAVLGGKIPEPDAVKPGQSSTLRTDPEIATAVLQQGVNLRLGQPTSDSVLREAE